MKCKSRNASGFLYSVLLLLIVCPAQALSGTVENATLTPSSSLLVAGTSQGMTFSAVNNTSFEISSYEVRIHYEEGLSLSNFNASHGGTITDNNTKKNYVEITWTTVGPEDEISAAFDASSAPGEYTIEPKNIRYKIGKTGYSGTTTRSPSSTALP